MNAKLIYLCIISIIFFSCQKEEGNNNVPTSTSSFIQTIQVRGRVFLRCNSNVGLENFTIHLGRFGDFLTNVVTDSTGYYEINLEYDFLTEDAVTNEGFNLYLNDQYPEFYYDVNSGSYYPEIQSLEEDTINFDLRQRNELKIISSLHKLTEEDYLEFDKCEFIDEFGTCIQFYRDSVSYSCLGEGTVDVKYLTMKNGSPLFYNREINCPCQGDTVYYISH